MRAEGDVGMSKQLTPLAFTRNLVEHLSQVRATESTVEEAKNFLSRRRELRKRRPARESGYEYVVEIMLRPTITLYAQNALFIPPDDSHRRIYSSHFHTTSDGPGDWRARWDHFKGAYPNVDTDEDGHSRRADLFISMGTHGLVSIEFKYLRAKSNPGVSECVRQIRQHLTKHCACVLVVYAASPVSVGFERAVHEIRTRLRDSNGLVVVVAGPPIQFS
jgi:hypothetical protein